jgi:hypothetical protein
LIHSSLNCCVEAYWTISLAHNTVLKLEESSDLTSTNRRPHVQYCLVTENRSLVYMLHELFQSWTTSSWVNQYDIIYHIRQGLHFGPSRPLCITYRLLLVGNPKVRNVEILQARVIIHEASWHHEWFTSSSWNGSDHMRVGFCLSDGNTEYICYAYEKLPLCLKFRNYGINL